MAMSVKVIDAYWLQRQISEAFKNVIDPQQSQILVEEVLKILGDEDDREAENKLLVHLDFDKFSLVKYLLRNRRKVVWCTRLARAEDERKRIEEEMMTGLDPELAAMLEELHAIRATAKERQKDVERKIKEEALRLMDNNAADRDHRGPRGLAEKDSENGRLNGQHQLLDLDSIAFEQGGCFVTKTKTILPDGSFRHQAKGYEEVHIPALKANHLNKPNKW